MGRYDEAISHANRSLEIDPLSYFSMTSKYHALFYAGHKSEALELAEEARDSYPNNPYIYWLCAVFYTELGMFNEALSTLQTQITFMETENISDEIGLLGYIYGQLDQIDKAQEQLTQLDELNSKGLYVSPRTRVRVYLGLNDLEKAIEILERASEDHSIDPYFFRKYSIAHENLRSNPRFIELLRKVGLIE